MIVPKLGERWALLGRNASGKTTLLRRMATDLKDCALLPQHHRDSFALPVRDWVLLHANTDANTQLAAIAAQLDIAHLLARPVTELSGGERQRVGLAAVAIQNRTVWLLDEPISAQDPAHQLLIAHWLASKSDIAMVFAAHDVHWVHQVATHVFAFLENGKKEQGTKAQMLTSAKLTAIFGCEMVAPAPDSSGVLVPA